MKPTIPLLLPHLERRHKKALSDEVKTLILQISPASIDRVLAPYRAQYKRGRSLTKPESLLRSQIPISTEVWDVTTPGYVEADTVSHCGSSGKGPFVVTVGNQSCACGEDAMRVNTVVCRQCGQVLDAGDEFGNFRAVHVISKGSLYHCSQCGVTLSGDLIRELSQEKRRGRNSTSSLSTWVFGVVLLSLGFVVAAAILWAAKS